jgi:hypothetical protein
VGEGSCRWEMGEGSQAKVYAESSGRGMIRAWLAAG